MLSRIGSKIDSDCLDHIRILGKYFDTKLDILLTGLIQIAIILGSILKTTAMSLRSSGFQYQQTTRVLTMGIVLAKATSVWMQPPMVQQFFQNMASVFNQILAVLCCMVRMGMVHTLPANLRPCIMLLRCLFDRRDRRSFCKSGIMHAQWIQAHQQHL